MLIRHFSKDDISGGAAKAAYRLHQALREAGVQSQMIVRNKKSEDEEVIQLHKLPPQPWQSRLDRLKRHIPGLGPEEIKADYTYNFDRAPDVDLKPIFDAPRSSDNIICLHWINGLLDAKSIRRIYERFQSPVFWVIHDLEPFTGGCHYAFGCEGFTRQCGCCPRLGSNDPQDLSNQIWLRKRDALTDLPIHFIAPTSWGEARARESSLFSDHEVVRIPLPMDTRVFRSLDKRVARDVLRLPQEKKIVLIGATYLDDRRKGMDHLVEALGILLEIVSNRSALNREDILLLIVGQNGRNLMPRLPFANHYLGHICDDLMMALAYQAADLFACSSLEDSGPMMISEAMLCETPVVAFNAGIAPDVIEHLMNGYIAQYRDNRDFAEGMFTLLTHPDPAMVQANARDSALRLHSPRSVADQHLDLYRKAVSCR